MSAEGAAGFDAALEEVLGWRRYDRLMGRQLDIRRWAAEQAERLLDRLFGNFAGFGGGEYDLGTFSALFAATGVLILLLAAFIIVRSIIRSRGGGNSSIADLFPELGERKYASGELLAMSDGAGDERLAVRYRYMAALAMLGESRRIEISPSATNRAIERQLGKSAPGLLPGFSAVASVFHRSWFGYKAVGDALMGEYREAVDSLGAVAGGDRTGDQGGAQ